MSTTKTEKYQPLTEISAIKLVKKLGLFDATEALTAREIGDGNLNLVFHIINDQTNKSIIVKQALPYAKVVGESWPLSLNRATIESNALKQFGAFTLNSYQLCITTMKRLLLRSWKICLI